MLSQLGVRFPTVEHRSALESALADYTADERVRGIGLIGSICRGHPRTDSDIDLLVLATEDFRPPNRQYRHGVPIDLTIRTREQWRRRFARARPMWVYAWVECIALHDPHGELAVLRAEAQRTLDGYQTAERLAELSALWAKAAPKMREALRSGLPATIGYWSAVMLEEFLETVWLMNDKPLPSHVMSRLADLHDPVCPEPKLRAILEAPPARALALELEVLREAVLRMPPPPTAPQLA